MVKICVDKAKTFAPILVFDLFIGRWGGEKDTTGSMESPFREWMGERERESWVHRTRRGPRRPRAFSLWTDRKRGRTTRERREQWEEWLAPIIWTRTDREEACSLKGSRRSNEQRKTTTGWNCNERVECSHVWWNSWVFSGPEAKRNAWWHNMTP